MTRTLRAMRIVVVAVITVVAAACSGGTDSGSGSSPVTQPVTSSSSTTSTTMPPLTGDLAVLTYNVAGLPAGLSQSNPEANAPEIGRRLDAYDLVVFQEDFGFYSDLIEAEASHPHRSERHPGPEALNPVNRAEALVGDGLNRYSKYPFAPVERFPWSGCFGGADVSDGGSADCLSLKGFSVATTTLDAGVEIDVYNLHVEAGGTNEDLRLAAADLEELGAEIATRSTNRAVLVGGDWNLHPDRPEEAAILDDFRETAGMTDVCEVVDCGADADEIDRMMFRSSETLDLIPVSHRFERAEFVDAEGAPLSDHDPLAVQFAWVAAK